MVNQRVLDYSDEHADRVEGEGVGGGGGHRRVAE